MSQASQEFANRSGSKLCELVLLENRLHDVHRDNGSDEVFATFIRWINHQLVLLPRPSEKGIANA